MKNGTEVLKEAMRERKLTQSALALEMGVSQNGLSANINRPRMSLDNFVTILSAMEYDVVVVDRCTGKEKWVVG